MRKFLYLAALSCAVSALTKPETWSPWNPDYHPPQNGANRAHSLYVMTNDVSGNSVISMSIQSDGTLFGGDLVATGGNGSNYIASATGKPAFPDALSAQDAMVQSDGYLFVVNAGSDSISMLKVMDSGLELLGQPQSSMGEFPTTLAVSTIWNIVCVGNTGKVSGIACATFSETGLSAFDALRPLDVGQSLTPPTGPVPGIGDILFSAEDANLLVMVKGNGTEFTGYAAVFPVDNGVVSQMGSHYTPPGSAVLFGSANIPGSVNKILTSDAGVGGLILDIDNLAAEPVAVIKVAGQKASCWAQVSTLTGTGFITDAGLDRLVEVNLESGAIVSEYEPPTPFGGMTDFRINGEYLWALSASNGSYPSSITTFGIGGEQGGPRLISTYAIPFAGVNTQGMALA